MAAIADAMGAGARTRDIEAAPRFVAALLSSLPVKKRLHDIGVPGDALDSVAAEAAENATVRANPRPVTEREIRQLLQQAW
jgi:alcohol dehydrogenase class IV